MLEHKWIANDGKQAESGVERQAMLLSLKCDRQERSPSYRDLGGDKTVLFVITTLQALCCAMRYERSGGLLCGKCACLSWARDRPKRGACCRLG